jgi:hypothetical protein
LDALIGADLEQYPEVFEKPWAQRRRIELPAVPCFARPAIIPSVSQDEPPDGEQAEIEFEMPEVCFYSVPPSLLA